MINKIYDWDKMEGRDILQAFADDPAALKNCEWVKSLRTIGASS